jgi:hypothetical protein
MMWPYDVKVAPSISEDCRRETSQLDSSLHERWLRRCLPNEVSGVSHQIVQLRWRRRTQPQIAAAE